MPNSSPSSNSVLLLISLAHIVAPICSLLSFLLHAFVVSSFFFSFSYIYLRKLVLSWWLRQHTIIWLDGWSPEKGRAGCSKLKKREDKKEEADSATRFARFLFTLSWRWMDHGFWARHKVVTIRDNTQGSPVCLSPPKLTFSAYTPLWRYIDQSKSSLLISYLPLKVKCMLNIRMSSFLTVETVW